jgi:glutaredoxin-like protein NrdH
MITVYTRPGCGPCTATKVWLRRNRIEFVEREPDEALDAIGHGFTSLPIVIAGTECWSGFRIDKLAGLKAFHPSNNSDGIAE